MDKTFILDEWIWSDLRGDNGEERQKETFLFLEKLFQKCDKIAVARNSKFQQKEWNFYRIATDPLRRGIARFYINSIRFNHSKYEEIEIEEESALIENINPDDIYLVKTYNRTGGEIITTDSRLIEACKSQNISCKHRDELLHEYL